MKRERYLRNTKLIAVVAALVLLAIQQAGAASLEVYRERVDSAWKKAAGVERALSDSDVDPGGEREFVEQIRREFPASERVEWSGGSVEISNEWLLGRVAEFEKGSDIK